MNALCGKVSLLGQLDPRSLMTLEPSGLIHSGDSQIARRSSSSPHESRNCRQRHSSGSPSA
jgi:hypothetical protein